MGMPHFQNLSVFKEAVELITQVYKVLPEFPRTELYGLQDQMRRSSVSIASNIAEGRGRGTDRDYQRFLAIARGSCHELEAQIHVAGKLGFLILEKQQSLFEQTEVVGRMLTKLISSLDPPSSPWKSLSL